MSKVSSVADIGLARAACSLLLAALLLNAATQAQAQSNANPEASSNGPPFETIRYITRPRPETLSQLYPTRAARAGQTGWARLDCTVQTDGYLSCVVYDESPSGWGFGAAALNSVRGFRALAGQEGKRTLVPIAFGLAPPAPPPQEAAPRPMCSYTAC